MDDALELSTAAAAEWMYHVESILRGVGHALNNRASAIAASVELLGGEGGDPGDAAAGRDIAAGEAQRIAALARLIRSLGDVEGPPQAFAPADVAAEAAELLALHRDFRDGAPAFETQAAVPVRTHRALLLRAIIALTTAGPAPVRITLAAEGDWLVVTGVPAPAPGAPRAPLAGERARAMGGELLRDGRYGLRIPTLAALRRREGR